MELNTKFYAVVYLYSSTTTLSSVFLYYLYAYPIIHIFIYFINMNCTFFFSSWQHIMYLFVWKYAVTYTISLIFTLYKKLEDFCINFQFIFEIENVFVFVVMIFFFFCCVNVLVGYIHNWNIMFIFFLLYNHRTYCLIHRKIYYRI